jgi:AcrR family transcriptional regulator
MSGRATPRARDSEATKAAILAAAREHFAGGGYELATIRGIAADAGIDPALVMRYFGNKEKLFAAAADFDLRLPDLTALPREKVGAALAAHFLDRWEGDDTFMALLRSAVTNEAAAKRIRAVMAGQVAPAIAAFCADPARLGTRAALLSSQILGMALCRYILRLPPAVAMTRAEVVTYLGPTLQRYIAGDLDQGAR